jgi:hypothetical protein
MKTTQWDRVASSAPLNKTAGIVRDGKGSDNGTRRQVSQGLRDTPFVLKPVPTDLPDYTGTVHGRLTVMGLIDPIPSGMTKNANRGARWSLRCICGRYEPAKTSTVKNFINPNSVKDRCIECTQVKRIQQGFGSGKDKPLLNGGAS